jgi:branched-chain amino acid transport system substrate-binding protein
LTPARGCGDFGRFRLQRAFNLKGKDRMTPLSLGKKRRRFGPIAATMSTLWTCAILWPVTPADAASPVRLGTPVALTGALAEEGTKLLHGLEMCVDAVNAKGGIQVGAEKRPLELVKYDYQSETNRAVQLVQRLMTVDKVDFLFAPYGSGDTKVAAVVAERYDVPMIASSAATPAVFDQNLKNLFGILFPNAAVTEAEVTHYKATVPGIKTVAILALNSLFPKAIAAQLKATATKEGLEAVYDGLYSPGSLDFSNILTEIKAKNPDWIYASGYIQDLILLRRQMASLGMNPKVVTMNAGAAYPEFEQNLGPLSNNVTSSAWWHPSVTYTDKYLFGGAKEYTEAFQKKYSKTASYLEASSSAGCEVLVKAIETAGTTKADAVRKVLAEAHFETFYGPIKFGPNGQNQVSSPVILQIQDGKFAVLTPATVKTGDLRIGLGKP